MIPAFAVEALSLAGLPPFSGFVAKLGVISAGIDADQTLIVIVALVAGALTLLSMTKIWIGVFWGEATEASAGPPALPSSRTNRNLMIGATSLAVAGTLAISAMAGGLYDLADRAAEDLRDQNTYIALTQSPDS